MTELRAVKVHEA